MSQQLLGESQQPPTAHPALGDADSPSLTLVLSLALVTSPLLELPTHAQHPHTAFGEDGGAAGAAPAAAAGAWQI